MKYKFTIYGCCVTRDIFNFMDNEVYCPDLTIGTSPIMSLFSDGLEIKVEDVDVAENNYVNRMTYNNIASKTLSKLQETESEYFIFDLAEERLPIQDWSLNEKTSVVPVTWNTHRTYLKLKENKHYNNLNATNWRFADSDIQLYKQKIKKFIELIKNKFPQDKIIYVPLQQTDDILDEESYCMKSLTQNKNEFPGGIENINFRKRQDRVIRLAEQLVLEELPECWVLPIPEGVFGSTAHHFGAHPLHFGDLFYEYCAETVKLIVKERGDSLIEKKVVMKNIDFICKIYKKKFMFIRKQLEDINKESIQFIGERQYKNIFSNISGVSMRNPIVNIAVSSLLSGDLKVSKLESTEVEFLNDANKTYLDMIVYGKTQWLIIDLLSECLDRVGVEGIGEMMNNYEEVATNILTKKYPNCEVMVKKYNEQSFEVVLGRLLEFIEIVKEKYDEKKIIVNEAYYHESYLTSSGEIIKYDKDVCEKNKFLKRLYDEIYKIIPNCRIIKMLNVASYSEGMPEYKTMEEYIYYQKALNTILNENEIEYAAMINEYNYKLNCNATI